jgi:hypothetical protein
MTKLKYKKERVRPPIPAKDLVTRAYVKRKIAKLKQAGGILSNVAFNSKQNKALPRDLRVQLERYQKEWDKALSEMPRWMVTN